MLNTTRLRIALNHYLTIKRGIIANPPPMIIMNNGNTEMNLRAILAGGLLMNIESDKSMT